MTYEIPQQLEYHEKIMFGLTAKQLGYAFLFGLPAFLLFIKLPYGLYNLFASIPLGMLAIALMFLNFDRWLVEFVKWLRYRRLDTESKIKNFIKLGGFYGD